jgi:ABC-type Fe3+-hydroxamate transport system substrate-binding protein
MPAFTDQTGRTIELNAIPRRIISLVPSQTELLFDLGLDQEVVGITKFCIRPAEWFYTKTRIGGTKKIHIDIIHQLQPDLIIANKEENVKEQVEELAHYYPVWISDITNLDNACQMIEQIGLLTGTIEKANSLITKIKLEFSKLECAEEKARTAYLIWNDPYMTVGGDTFIHYMLEAAGFENVFKNRQRYPEITIDDLLIANCQLLLLSSEPFPFKQKHMDEIRQKLNDAGMVQTKIMLVDGEMFSWYGSRLQYAPGYFKKLRAAIDTLNIEH